MIRQRKPYMVLTFSTTTAAMSMEKKCREQQIPGRLIPVPREITAGCGLAWRMTTEEYKEFGGKIMELGISVEQKKELIL